MKTRLILLLGTALLLGSCTTLNKVMKEPNSRVEFQKEDFILSGQLSAEANCVKVLGIDFERLFNSSTGSVSGGGVSAASIPIVGNFVSDPTSSYALFNLMNSNKGYDVVLYPQFETKVYKPVGIPIVKITTVKVTARLGKLK